MILRILIISIVFFCTNSTIAQSESFKTDVIKLVNKTFDVQNFENFEYLMLYENNIQIKESFANNLKKAKEVFYTEIATYYSSKYTHDEIKQMLAFYETPVGKKIAGDLLLLSTNSFPKDKEWKNQLEAIKIKK